MSEPIAALPVEDTDGADSSYGDDVASSKTSITSSIRQYEIENGRSYHSYKAGKYILPNDEEEQDRLDITYHAWRMLFENKPFYAPIGDNPQKIVDIGTGTGIWAIDVGDLYPNAKVIGTDLSPIQPHYVPSNVQFEIEDATEVPWAFATDSIDLIHTRILNGFGVSDWKVFCKEAFTAVKPGGYIELQEFDLITKSDDNSLPPDSAIVKWCDLLVEGALVAGKTLRLSSSTLHDAMAEAGFVDIVVKEFKLPVGPWAADKKLRAPGKFALISMLSGLSSISMAIFTRLLGWSVEEMEALLAKVEAEWKQKSVHSYWPVFIVYGKKPLTS